MARGKFGYFKFVSKFARNLNIWARDLKHGQLIGGDELITWLTLKQILLNVSGVMVLCKLGYFKFVSKISQKKKNELGSRNLVSW